MCRGDIRNGDEFQRTRKKERGDNHFQTRNRRQTPYVSLSATQVKEILSQMRHHRCRLVSLIILCTGARIGEVLRLTMRDVDFANRRISIPNRYVPRFAPMPEILHTQLLAFTKSGCDTIAPDDRFFGQLSPKVIQYQLQRAARACGISFPVTSQVLRRTFVDMVFKMGIPVSQTFSVLGQCSQLAGSLVGLDPERWAQIGREFGTSDEVKSEL